MKIVSNIIEKIREKLSWISNNPTTSSHVYNEDEVTEIFEITSEMIGDAIAAQNNGGEKRSMRLEDLRQLNNKLSSLKDKLINYNNNDENSLAEDVMDIFFSKMNVKKLEIIMSKEFITIEEQMYSNFLRQSIMKLINKLEKKIEMSNQQNTGVTKEALK